MTCTPPPTTTERTPSESELVIAEAREEAESILQLARENRTYAEKLLVAVLIAHDAQLSASQGEAERLRGALESLVDRDLRYEGQTVVIDALTPVLARDMISKARAVLAGANRGGA